MGDSEGEIWDIARQASEMVSDGMTLGLGTGRAASMFVRAIASRVKDGLNVRGVPTSRATESLAQSLGVPLASLAEIDRLDLDVDGADEVDPKLNLIKGHGGALVRERVVASRSNKFVVLVGEEKLVPHLGAKREVPVECVPFAVPVVNRELRELGAEANLRETRHGVFKTDNDNYILDARFDRIDDPQALELRIDRLPGVVDSGLFVQMADLVLVQAGEQTQRLEAKA